MQHNCPGRKCCVREKGIEKRQLFRYYSCVKRLGNKIISFILKRPLFVIILGLAVILGALSFLPKIKIDNSVDVFFDKTSKSYIDFEAWKEQFGSDQVVIVVFRDKDIFTEENLKLISGLTRKFESLKYVDEVTSLANVNDIAGYENDFVVRRLVSAIPSSQAELEALKKQALANPLYVNNLISRDGRVAAILVELEHRPQSGDVYKKEVIENIQEILKKEFPKDKKYYLSGFTAIEFFYASYMQDDLKTFLPFVFLIIIAILFFTFRSIAGFLLPLVAILSSLILTMLFLYLCGFSINNITTIIPPIMLAIAMADSIHLVVESLQKKKAGREALADKDSFLFGILRHLSFPCFLTTFTTAVGFLSLTVSRIPPVRELGLTVGVGVFFAFIITFTFLPALIKKFNLLQNTDSYRLKETDEHRLKSPGRKMDRFLTGIGRFNEKFRFFILGFTAVLIIFSLWGLSKIKAETSVLEYFKKGSPIHKSTTFIEENLSGVHFLNASFKAEAVDYFKEPEVLRKIEEFQTYLQNIPEVDKTTSVVDYIKEINKSFHNEDDDFYKIPLSKKMIAQYLLIYGADDLNNFVDSNWQWSSVRIRLKEHSTYRLKRVIVKINDYLEENFKENVKAKTVGQTILEVETNEAVTQGQVESIALAMAIIFGMMFLIFKSISVGLVSILPNILPILVNFGIMGWLGIRLDSATSMISAVGIGIIVDDTIHFLHSFKEELSPVSDYNKAMYGALKQKGRPIIFTSVILCFGFGILSFSQFVPTFYFGLLSALLMFNALLADLIVLPCLLICFKPKFKR